MGEFMKKELLKGLQSKPMYIPSWYRYDKEGSRLNDLCIEQSKWYYYHRSEMSLLQNITEDVVSQLNENNVLVDLGSGNAAKTKLLIDQLLLNNESIIYIPVDISEEYLHMVSNRIKREYGSKISVQPIGGEYLDAIEKIRVFSQRKLFVWFGSLQSIPYNDQVKYLSEIANAMKADDRLLITLDITDSSKKQMIETAYLDPDGFAGNLHLNSVHRLNKEMEANIDVSRFTIKNELKSDNSTESCSYVSVWIESDTDCEVNVRRLNLSVGIKKGDKIFLHGGNEMSCKYNMRQIRHLCEKGSLEIIDYWTNEHVACLLLCMKA